MQPLIQLPLDLFEQPEFQQLHQRTTSGQFKQALTLWTILLFKAAKLGQAGQIFSEPLTPLTLGQLREWFEVTRTEYVARPLQLLCDCRLIAPAANGQYCICNWRRYQPVGVTEHGGMVKFQSAQAAALPSLQHYTAAQQARLAKTTAKVLAYLQQGSGKQFPVDVTTQLLLANLFNQQVTMQQIKQVIDWKIKDWRDTDYWLYVRPKTLFGPKFQQYLQEAPPLPTARPVATQSRTQYLQMLYNVCSGDIDFAIKRAANEAVTTTHTEMEAIGHALGH